MKLVIFFLIFLKDGTDWRTKIGRTRNRTSWAAICSGVSAQHRAWVQRTADVRSAGRIKTPPHPWIPRGPAERQYPFRELSGEMKK